jgi:methionyl aminopeptidase
MMSRPKSPEELEIMAEGGAKLRAIRNDLIAMAAPGVSLLQIEQRAMDGIRASGGSPSFTTVEDYKWATCLCVNEQVVHGIPSPYVLQNMDILTVDVGILYKGFHTDTADSCVVGGEDKAPEPIQRFLDVGRQTLKDAIAVAVAGNRIGHISAVIDKKLRGAGYFALKALTGHAVGHTLHEEPMIPGYIDRKLERTALIVPGMTLAIEIIYSMGSHDIKYAGNDGWTLSTRDGSLSAVFEHTVAVYEDKTIVLT